MPDASNLADFQQREALLLAPYAMHSAASAGRRHPEPAHSYRAPFQRDRDRIVHSAAYRRLSHKTQVFTGELGDYHRSRLTHTQECSSIARTVARVLRLNEDLVEALALVHDLGHPPFGHAGEDTLNECLRGCGGFNHNQQALRIVEELEHRYPSFPGLNLSVEVLESQGARIRKSELAKRPLLEAQVVDAADSVAYDTHDADDALELGLLTLEELQRSPLWAEATRRVGRRFTALSAADLRRAVIHELIDWQVGDLIASTRDRINSAQIDSVATVREGPPLAAPSAEMAELKRQFESVLSERVYRHPRVTAVRSEVQVALRRTFDHYLAKPDQLPTDFQSLIAKNGLPRSVADYLACLTDRAAQRESQRLFS
jgi:dGTPase